MHWNAVDEAPKTWGARLRWGQGLGGEGGTKKQWVH